MEPKANNPMISVTGSPNCHVCNDLLKQLNQFFEILESARKHPSDQWLTVEDVAEELKISKSIVYRIIRNGELEAINIVETGGKIAMKGHYRVKRKSLEQYLEQKKVKPIPQPHSPSRPCQRRFLPKVKNHLGL